MQGNRRDVKHRRVLLDQTIDQLSRQSLRTEIDLFSETFLEIPQGLFGGK